VIDALCCAGRVTSVHFVNPRATPSTVWSFFKEISTMTTITQVCKPIPEERRAAYARKVFGSGYPLLVEPVVFAMADMLSPDYNGGMWLYCGICPEGTMYSYPDTDDSFRVVSPNGFEGTMSSEAFGITACLFTYSHMAFGKGRLAEVCAQQFHGLRQYTLDHPEAGLILAACD
jgi:hypothetical protein